MKYKDHGRYMLKILTEHDMTPSELRDEGVICYHLGEMLGPPFGPKIPRLEISNIGKVFRDGNVSWWQRLKLPKEDRDGLERLCYLWNLCIDCKEPPQMMQIKNDRPENKNVTRVMVKYNLGKEIVR